MHYAMQGKYLVLTGEYRPRNIMKHVQASKFLRIRGAVRKSHCNTDLPVIRESKDQLNLSSRCNEINTGVFESIYHRSHITSIAPEFTFVCTRFVNSFTLHFVKGLSTRHTCAVHDWYLGYIQLAEIVLV